MNSKVTDVTKKLESSLLGKPKYITIHHTQGSGKTEKDYLQYVRSGLHMKKDGKYKMGDIAYHYLIGPSGQIYEGRNLKYATNSGSRYFTEKIWRSQDIRTATNRDEGRHVGEVEWMAPLQLTRRGIPDRPGAVAGHITICFIGDYFTSKPNKKMQEAFIHLAGYLCKKHELNSKNIWMHREVANSGCPGDNIYKAMRVPPRGDKDHSYKLGPWLKSLEKKMSSL